MERFGASYFLSLIICPKKLKIIKTGLLKLVVFRHDMKIKREN